MKLNTSEKAIALEFFKQAPDRLLPAPNKRENMGRQARMIQHWEATSGPLKTSYNFW